MATSPTPKDQEKLPKSILGKTMPVLNAQIVKKRSELAIVIHDDEEEEIKIKPEPSKKAAKIYLTQSTKNLGSQANLNSTKNLSSTQNLK